MELSSIRPMTNNLQAGGRALKRKLSSSCLASSPSPEMGPRTIDYVDTSTELPSPLLPTSMPWSTVLDIFPHENRAAPFRPLTPPELIFKEQSQRHLCMARLALLQELGHMHPLMRRVKINGALRTVESQFHRQDPTVYRTSHAQISTTNYTSPNSRHYKRIAIERDEQCQAALKHQTPEHVQVSRKPATAVDFCRRMETRTIEWVEGKLRNTEASDFCKRLQSKAAEWMENNMACAEELASGCRKDNDVARRKKEREWREALRVEIEMQRDIRGLNEVFEHCAVVVNEIEEEMVFPIEIGVAI
jgi:hypothetical protein